MHWIYVVLLNVLIPKALNAKCYIFRFQQEFNDSPIYAREVTGHGFGHQRSENTDYMPWLDRPQRSIVLPYDQRGRYGRAGSRYRKKH